MKHRSIAKKIQLINDFSKKSANEKTDPKDLDLLLSEINLMHSRAELYVKFLKRRVTVNI